MNRVEARRVFCAAIKEFKRGWTVTEEQPAVEQAHGEPIVCEVSDVSSCEIRII
jgi:regulator of RNase E activity RraB